MKIAVTYENGNIFQHFGHTEQFKIYDVGADGIADSFVVSTNGQGHGALADLLEELGVEALICGGIGGGAKLALATAGIKIYGACSGDADAAVEAYLAGKLDYNPDVMCNHHHSSGDGYSCSHHDHECHHEHEHNCNHGSCHHSH